MDKQDGFNLETGSGVKLIALERDRQKRIEGFDDLHDDQWINDELVKAAAYYALPYSDDYNLGALWPFSPEWNKKPEHNRIRQLMIAGALIAAEIDRLERLAQRR